MAAVVDTHQRVDRPAALDAQDRRNFEVLGDSCQPARGNSLTACFLLVTDRQLPQAVRDQAMALVLGATAPVPRQRKGILWQFGEIRSVIDGLGSV